MRTEDEFFAIIKEMDSRPTRRYKIDSNAVCKEEIKEYMKKNHLSKRKFAKKCGISVTELSKILNEQVHLESVFKIEKIMGVEEGTLIDPIVYKYYFLLNIL